MKIASGAILAIGICLIAGCAPASNTGIAGHPAITDGDTLRFADTRVRIDGIDAPEAGQMCLYTDGTEWACGSAATEALVELIANHEVSCESLGTDRYDRVIGRCSVDQVDIGEWMVRSGWALAYRRYSMDYVDEEAQAEATSVGVWQGTFQTPWDWRAAQREAD